MAKNEINKIKSPRPTKDEMAKINSFMEKEIIKYKKKVAKQNEANEAFASKPKQNRSKTKATLQAKFEV